MRRADRRVAGVGSPRRRTPDRSRPGCAPWETGAGIGARTPASATRRHRSRGRSAIPARPPRARGPCGRRTDRRTRGRLRPPPVPPVVRRSGSDPAAPPPPGRMFGTMDIPGTLLVTNDFPPARGGHPAHPGGAVGAAPAGTDLRVCCPDWDGAGDLRRGAALSASSASPSAFLLALPPSRRARRGGRGGRSAPRSCCSARPTRWPRWARASRPRGHAVPRRRPTASSTGSR